MEYVTALLAFSNIMSRTSPLIAIVSNFRLFTALGRLRPGTACLAWHARQIEGGLLAAIAPMELQDTIAPSTFAGCNPNVLPAVKDAHGGYRASLVSGCRNAGTRFPHARRLSGKARKHPCAEFRQ